VGLFTSIALDPSGHPHISYCDWADGDLKYAKLGAGAPLIVYVGVAGTAVIAAILVSLALRKRWVRGPRAKRRRDPGPDGEVRPLVGATPPVLQRRLQ